MSAREWTGDSRDAAGISSYTKRWEKDSAQDTDHHRDKRIDEYKGVVNSYYDGATSLYIFGWGTSFHFARYYKGESFFQALARHEHYLSSELQLKPGMRVLDVGCGVGGPAREIARFSGCEIVGVTLNQYQVNLANNYTQKSELAGKVTFVQGDFMKLSELFGENSFDAVYAIEATVHAPTWEGVYGEIKKVLKPGCKVGIYEWCMTDKWDASVPKHKEIAHGIELGNGIAEMRTIKKARQALTTVGFEILHEEDLAARPDKIPWYYPLEGDLFKVQTLWDCVMVFRMTRVGIFFTQGFLKVAEKLHIVPQGVHDVGEALIVAANSLIAGGQTKLFTPMMLFVARKPE